MQGILADEVFAMYYRVTKARNKGKPSRSRQKTRLAAAALPQVAGSGPAADAPSSQSFLAPVGNWRIVQLLEQGRAAQRRKMNPARAEATKMVRAERKEASVSLEGTS